MLKKLKHRFVLFTMLIVSFILVIGLIAIYMVAFRMARNQIYIELNNASAEIIGDETLFIEEAKNPDAPIFEPSGSPFSTVTVILDADDKIESAYYNGSKTATDDSIITAATAILDARGREGIIFEKYIIFHEISFSTGRKVVSFTSLNTLLGRVGLVINASAIVIACCIGIFFILSYILAGVAMRPVEMAWEREKQFVADASHDLKTPLTVIMANTEIIRNHKSNSISDVAKWLDSTKEEAERMKRLVESMLELAKSECINETITLSDINISDICERTVLQMEPIAFEKNVFITTSISQNTIIKSNADYFTRLTHILIDNAIKYAKDGSGISVKLKRQKREIKLSIFNEGSYIPEENIPHLFERFWRSDQARTSESFGLGLSIAKNLCENLGGRITVSSDKNTGTEFCAIFPM